MIGSGGERMFRNLLKKSSPPEPLPHLPQLEDCLKGCIQHYCVDHEVPLKALMKKLERDIIFLVLESNQGKLTTSAHILGLKPNTLRNKIHELGIKPVRTYIRPDDFLEPNHNAH